MAMRRMCVIVAMIMIVAALVLVVVRVIMIVSKVVVMIMLVMMMIVGVRVGASAQAFIQHPAADGDNRYTRDSA